MPSGLHSSQDGSDIVADRNSGGDQYGVYSNGSPVMVSGSKLVGYTGAGVFAGGGTVDVQNNQFDSCAIGVQGAGGSSIISNNKFNGRGSKVPNGTVRTLFCDSKSPTGFAKVGRWYEFIQQCIRLCAGVD